jgi:hypothetical protein
MDEVGWMGREREWKEVRLVGDAGWVREERMGRREGEEIDVLSSLIHES